MPANKYSWNDRIGEITMCQLRQRSSVEAKTHLVKGGKRKEDVQCQSLTP